MGDPSDPKTALHSYLREARDAVIWKLDGLSERDARLPRTPTGNNLLGLLKHCLNVEAAYFGTTFGREFPTPHELLSTPDFEVDPQADWYARETETKIGLIDLYRRVGRFADETIEELPLDAVGRVPWWGPGGREVTLHRVMVHVIYDVARHAGHVDIMRELIDGEVGMQPGDANVPEGYDWPGYVHRLTSLADRFE